MKKRNLKAVGPLFLVALALSAVAATGAQGTSPANFWADGFPAVLKGAQESPIANNFFESTPERRVECTTADYQATLEVESNELTVTPHYSGCKAFGLSATITLNNCHFKFTAVTTVTSTESTGKADVICAKDQSITVSAGFGACVVHVTGSGNGQNQNLTGVTFTRISSTTTTVKVNIQNQIHSHETNVFGCPTPNATATEGDFVSNVLVHCFKDAPATDGPTAGTTDTYGTGEATNCEVI